MKAHSKLLRISPSYRHQRGSGSATMRSVRAWVPVLVANQNSRIFARAPHGGKWRESTPTTMKGINRVPSSGFLSDHSSPVCGVNIWLCIRLLSEMAKKKKIRATEEDEEDLHQSQEDVKESADEEKSLYEILGVVRTSSHQEIKKAYHKLALRLHPDKNPGDEEAKEKFQLLQKVISILGDEEKRAIYDQTGCVDDADLAGEVVQNLREYFRSLYKKVTEADIEEFEAKYRGSDIEIKDLKDLYIKYKGNMNKLFCSMICSEPRLDSHRFKNIIDEAIALGELMPSKTYQKWAMEVAETKPPTEPLKQRGKSKKKTETENDLLAVISQRRSQRKEQFDSMFSDLEKKYSGGQSASEPTEEEFEAARKRLEQKNKQKKKR